MISAPVAQHIETLPIERLVEKPRNPRKNDKAADRMCASIQELGFKIPAGSQRRRSSRRPGSAESCPEAGLTEIPVILCDE